MTILIAFLVLMFIVAVHEFGHFYAAKLLKVPVKEFSVGMGPSVFRFKRNETEYHFRAIPIGGYVKYGDGLENVRDMRTIPAGKRAFIVAAGPMINMISAYVFLVILNTMRSGSLFSSFGESVQELGILTSKMLKGIIMLLTGKVPLESLSGPVGIVQIGSEFTAQGLETLLFFIIILNINLALMNLIPIPVLDGGQLAMIALEKLKILNVKVEVGLRVFGGVIVLGLFVIGFWNDIWRIFS